MTPDRYAAEAVEELAGPGFSDLGVGVELPLREPLEVIEFDRANSLTLKRRWCEPSA